MHTLSILPPPLGEIDMSGVSGVATLLGYGGDEPNGGDASGAHGGDTSPSRGHFIGQNR